MKRFRGCAGLLLFCAMSPACFAGPLYVRDDPEPTGYRHFEIYAFAQGTNTRAGNNGATGIDFNHGAARDLQLTAVAPLEFDASPSGGTSWGLGNVELAANIAFCIRMTQVGT
jgi:hypothetical protein